jgi:peptidoglycan/xylan/chitin deacetylase (PgdA/CDA1 family)
MWPSLFSLMSPGMAAGRLTVLIFHRVLPSPDALFPDEMHAEQFDSICGWMASWFNVLPLDEAMRRRESDTLPRRALAITFDDGYADNHDVALPILRKHGLSATFFIATGFLDGGRMWNDCVVESIRETPHSEIDLRSVAPGLGQYALTSLALRRSAIHATLSVVKYLPPLERTAAVQEIAATCGVTSPQPLMMRSDQVVAMRRAGMLIGAHTVNHPILTRLEPEEISREIADSRDVLAHLLGEPVRLFAYPNGKPGADYDEVAVLVVRKLGFDAAFSTAWGAVRPGHDRFQLPRFTPWDADRHRFGLRLARNLLLS